MRRRKKESATLRNRWQLRLFRNLLPPPDISPYTCSEHECILDALEPALFIATAYLSPGTAGEQKTMITSFPYNSPDSLFPSAG